MENESKNLHMNGLYCTYDTITRRTSHVWEAVNDLDAMRSHYRQNSKIPKDLMNDFIVLCIGLIDHTSGPDSDVPAVVPCIPRIAENINPGTAALSDMMTDVPKDLDYSDFLTNSCDKKEKK